MGKAFVMWRRWAGALTVCVGMGLAVAACGSGNDETTDSAAGTGASSVTAAAGEADKQVRLAAFVLATANTYSQSDIKGIQQAAKDAGNVEVRVFDGKFDGTEQAKQIEDAVASGQYNAFVVFPNDGAAVAPAVEEAGDEGIKVVAAYAPIGPNIATGVPQVKGVVGTVWSPNADNGEAIGKMTIAACAKEHPDSDPCKVAYISGGNGIAFEKAKFDAWKKTVAAADQPIQLVGQGEGGFLVDPSRTAAENLLQANPDLDVFATSGDQMATGAEQAINDAGRKGISIIGTGATKEGVAAVNDGRWFGTTMYTPIDEGRQAAQMAIDAVRGKDPDQVEINLFAANPLGQSYTRDTKGFTPQWSIGG